MYDCMSPRLLSVILIFGSSSLSPPFTTSKASHTAHTYSHTPTYICTYGTNTRCSTSKNNQKCMRSMESKSTLGLLTYDLYAKTGKNHCIYVYECVFLIFFCILFDTIAVCSAKQKVTYELRKCLKFSIIPYRYLKDIHIHICTTHTPYIFHE